MIQENNNRRLTVYTGTFGTLSPRFYFNDQIDILKHLYLAPEAANKMPIPKAVYKIIKVEPDNRIYVVVVVNDHFSSRSQIENYANGCVICKDICEKTPMFPCSDKYRIQTKEEEKAYIKRGYIYTCELQDFMTGLNSIYGIDLASTVA